MKEHIEREAALKCICSGCFEGNIIGNGFCGIPCDDYKLISEIPAADVRPVVRAVWRRYSPFTDTYECSNCGEQVIDQQFRTNFCPNCGADMRPQPPKEET